MPESVVRARSEVEAAWMLAEGRPGSRVIAGGTDLMPQMERGLDLSLVDIRRAGMNDLVFADDTLRLGAGVTIATLATAGDVREHFPALAAAASSFASVQVRNMATLGGSVGSARSHSDILPCLLAHEARLVVREGDARRTASLPEVLAGPGRTRLQPRELLCEIQLPRASVDDTWTVQRFLRVAAHEGAPALVNACVLLLLDGGVVEDARIALGGLGSTTVRAHATERFLVGRKLDRAAAVEAAGICAAEAPARDDVRASAAWRREVLRRSLGRLLLDEGGAR